MIKDIEGLLNKVCADIKAQCDVAVLGLSGGADSTLVACLCVRALGKENFLGINLPYNKFDEETFNARSRRLAQKLNIKNLDINIASAVDATIESLSKAGIELAKLPSGNIRARQRMIVQYAISNQLNETSGKRVRVIGSENASENALGFFTSHGDSGVDFNPIGSLYKSEVYQLLEYFRDQGVITEELIDRVPSAGLFDGHSDEGELGYSYNTMEPAMRHLMAGGSLDENDPVMVFVYKRYRDSQFKRDPIPTTPLREFCD